MKYFFFEILRTTKWVAQLQKLKPFLHRLPVRRKNFALCVHDDHVYVAGGIGVDGGYLNTVHRFAIKGARVKELNVGD